MDRLHEMATGPYDPIAKASAVVAGFGAQLTTAHHLRNSSPSIASMALMNAMAAWPVVCRVMAELEAARPEEAEQGRLEAERFLRLLDRRDGVIR